MALSFMEQFRAARRAGAPLIAVRTADPAATVTNIANDSPLKQLPMIQWDVVRGCIAVTKASEEMAKRMGNPEELANPVEMLVQAKKMPENSILFMLNLHRAFDNYQVVQAMANLRDTFKQNTRILVILCPDIKLPLELASDVLVLDEPLPDTQALAKIVGETYVAIGLSVPKDQTVELAVDALSGLAAFPAEQISAMSISKDGLDLDNLWERKRQTVKQTPGLSVWKPGDAFENVVGLENAKNYHRARGNGPLRRRGIVFIDEIDKHIANFGATGTGDTTTEMIGAILTEMEETEAEGSIFLGVPGSGKTMLAKAIAREWNIPIIGFDLAGMKGSLLGESGANVRNALKVVRAVTQGATYWVATCNRHEIIPPELMRRFRSSTFFFDSQSPKERAAAWEQYEKKYNIPKQDRPPDVGWTAAEIRNCCYNAYVNQCTLVAASKFVVPISKSQASRIRQLRKDADGAFTSASYEGTYKAPPDDSADIEEPPMIVAIGVVQPKRKIMTEESSTPPSGKKGWKN